MEEEDNKQEDKKKQVCSSSRCSTSNWSRLEFTSTWELPECVWSPGLLKQTTDEKEKRRTNNEDDKILEFKKTDLGHQWFVPREIIEQIDLNKPPPPGLLNEVEVPAPKADNENYEKVDGSRWSIFSLSTPPIPNKKKRTMPKEEDNMVHHQMSCIQKTSTITFQGSGSTSLSVEKVEEHRRILHDCYQPNKDCRQYNDKPKKQRVVKPAAQPAPQQIPGDIQEAILGYGGTEITWLSEKHLFESDRKKDQNRLFLPSDCFALLDSIMTDDEKKKYDVSNKNEDGSNTDGLKIKMFGPNLKIWDMDFKYWPSLKRRVFTGKWNQVVANLGLAKKDKVQIWCFRGPNRELCFAINTDRVPAPEPEPEPEHDAL